jgi:hypothetical protein
MSRSHPDWRLVHGFVVRGVKFSLVSLGRPAGLNSTESADLSAVSFVHSEIDNLGSS